MAIINAIENDSCIAAVNGCYFCDIFVTLMAKGFEWDQSEGPPSQGNFPLWIKSGAYLAKKCTDMEDWSHSNPFTYDKHNKNNIFFLLQWLARSVEYRIFKTCVNTVYLYVQFIVTLKDGGPPFFPAAWPALWPTVCRNASGHHCAFIQGHIGLKMTWPLLGIFSLLHPWIFWWTLYHS